MVDFIVASPFNGFPVMMRKNDSNDTAYDCAQGEVHFPCHRHKLYLSLKDAMRFYWLSSISDLNINLGASMYVNTGQDFGNFTINFEKNFTEFNISFCGDLNIIPEPRKRAKYTLSDAMYYITSREINGGIIISLPTYVDEDTYAVAIGGHFGFSHLDEEYIIGIGVDTLESSHVHKCNFTLNILEYEIPCSFLKYGTNYDDISMTASATVNSSYINT